MKLFLCALTFMVMIVMASVCAVAQDESASPVTTSLVCNSLRAAGEKPFSLKGTLFKKGSVHQTHLIIVDENSKTWNLVNLSPDLFNALLGLQNQSITAQVYCSGENIFDEVQIFELL